VNKRIYCSPRVTLNDFYQQRVDSTPLKNAKIFTSTIDSQCQRRQVCLAIDAFSTCRESWSPRFRSHAHVLWSTSPEFHRFPQRERQHDSHSVLRITMGQRVCFLMTHANGPLMSVFMYCWTQTKYLIHCNLWSVWVAGETRTTAALYTRRQWTRPFSHVETCYSALRHTEHCGIINVACAGGGYISR
jgi:hypothetical protein